jgi:phosphatidylglycerol lysyltransferase
VKSEEITEDMENMIDMHRARDLVLRYGWNVSAYQILNPGIHHWFSVEGDAVIGYVKRHNVWVVAGAPVCDQNRLGSAVASFEYETAQAGAHVCYLGADTRLELHFHSDSNHSIVVIGALPIWKPQHWPLILARRTSIRAHIKSVRNKGVFVSEWPPEQAENHPDLKRCLNEWLLEQRLPPMHFLAEPQILGRLFDRRVFVAEHGGDPVGFLVASPVPARNGWLIEQVIQGQNAPLGTAELIIDVVMRSMAEDGFDYVTLGLAPLSRRARVDTSYNPPWLNLIFACLRVCGRHFYNFDGLEAFKAKFQPDEWEPIFAISNEPRFSLGTLYAIAAAFSDGSPILTIARALLRVLRPKHFWIVERL